MSDLLYSVLKMSLEEVKDHFLHHIGYFVALEARPYENDRPRIRHHIIRCARATPSTKKVTLFWSFSILFKTECSVSF